jgi:hypothetical protein
MARRRSYGRRAYSRARGGYSRRGGLGGLKKLIIPVAGGAIDAIAPPIMGITGYGSAAVGYMMNDPVTCGIGAYQVGHSLAGKFLGGGGISSGGML